MQYGQRIQNPAWKKALRHRTRAAHSQQPDAGDPGQTTKSAARLAAEAAFTVPEDRSLPQHSAHISVRRTRLSSLAVSTAPEAHAAASSEQVSKASRVFRIEVAPKPQASDAAAPTQRALQAIDAPLDRQRDAGFTQQQLGTLNGELQRVTPHLETIAQLQTFNLVEERITRGWLRLFRRAAEIHAEILNARRRTCRVEMEAGSLRN